MQRELPWMGLGLSSNSDQAEWPNPYRVYDRWPGAFDYVEYSAPVSLVQARREASLFARMERSRDVLPLLFHPVHLNLFGPELEPPERLAELATHLAEVGSPWVSNDVAWWHVQGQGFPGYLYVPPPFDEHGLAAATAHAAHVQAHLPVPLLLENPAVVCARGSLHVLDFMAELHRRTGAPLLLDLGHLWSYQLTRDHPIDEAFDRFPFDQVVELHIAGGVLSERAGRRFYVDDHPQPIREELFSLLQQLLPRCSRLRAVTYEADGHPPELAHRTLQRLRALVPREPPGKVAALPEKRPAPSGPVSLDPGWLLLEVFTGRSAEDPVAAEVEAEFRGAVVAEALDRAWPLSRLLWAASPEALRAFLSSEEFTARGTQVEQAFGAYLRRQARGRGEAFAAVVALELWAQSATRHAPQATDQAGALQLGPGVACCEFPLDLGELLHGARAVRRHLAARMWGSGGLETAAFESLTQLVARAPPGPFCVVAVRTPQGLELHDGGEVRDVLRAASGAAAAGAELDPVALERALRRGWVRVGPSALRQSEPVG